MAYRVAVVGATGNVGREMLRTLAERKFPVSEVARRRLRAFGRRPRCRSARTSAQGRRTSTRSTSRAWTSRCSRPAPRSRRCTRRAPPRPACVVIDNTSQFRMDPDVPLVVPEVNPQAIAAIPQARHHRQSQLLDHPDGGGAEAAARCSRASSAWWWRPISRCRAPARRRWTSCSPRPRHLRQRSDPPEQFTKQIAFNFIPHIDVFMDDGSTKEEWKMVVETRKILDPDDPGHRHLRARAGVHRPCRGGERRVRAAAWTRTRPAPR